ncbi:MAG TPA: rRNA adenine N-6-methyltransferase family protein [Kofleriaceae bacterium]|jgi:protein-L-isoaspartate(D-aspartate) O-methyltransferase
MAATVDDARRWYAEEIREVAEIRCDALIDALARVPREAFLGPGPWQIVRPRPVGDVSYRTTPDADPRRLYHNVLVAIDPARKLNNGQPSAVITWLDALEPKRGDRALHVGAGVGYYTAIIADAVGPSGSVIAIEADAELAERARVNLATWPNVRVVAGDGATCDPGAFDIGFINCGATKLMPAWLDHVAPGGRLHVPMTSEALKHGAMLLVRRDDGDRWPARFTGGVAIYPCSGARDDDSDAALTELFKHGGVAKVQSVRRDAHERDDSCLMHRAGSCLSQLVPAR